MAISTFRAVRSMIYVGLEGGTAMLRWQMAQAWSHAVEWDTEVDFRRWSPDVWHLMNTCKCSLCKD